MSQDLVKDVGGTVETEFLSGRPASCTFKLIASDGTDIVASTPATVDTVNTTATVAAAARGLTATLTSVVGIVADGRRYLFDGEDVTVKSIATNTVTFWAPLMFDHAIGATFVGVRVTATVSAGDCADEFWDARAVFTPLTGNPQTEAVNCATDVIPLNLIGLQDVRDVNPNPQMSIAKELNLPRSLRVARETAVMMVGTKARAANHIGVNFFRRFASLVWWCQRRSEYGEQWAPELDKLEAERDAELARALGQSPRSDGEGGTVPGPGGAIPPDFNLAWSA